MSSPVEQIKQRLSVADVVGSYIKLQKAGANFKAVCPFHSEKAPSFYVSPVREIWHCFGCNRGGDMFEFVKQIEGVEFPEALRILADRAGVTVVFRKQDSQFQNERTRLLDLLKESALFYQKQLAQNKNVLNYLWKRGLKNETLRKFQVGFAPEEEKGWRFLTNYLKSAGYTNSEMEKVGLVVKKDSDYYDRFRGRIMFPLKDASGRIVGFSGRIFHLEAELPSGISTSSAAKYINTPQTILYDKSKILYGFELAKTEIRKKDVCILVEGQMDVLMSHQAEVQNAVAVSGTALTPAHLGIIKRLTNNLVMSFDGDEAGLSAAKRSVDLALQNNFEVRAVSLPQGKDPADVILDKAENWREGTEKSRHFIEFYLDVLKDKYQDREFKKQVEKNVLPYINLIQSEIDKSHWVGFAARELGVKEEIVAKELSKLARDKSVLAEVEKNSRFDGRSRKELLLDRLAGIVLWKKNKKLIPQFAKQDILNILTRGGEEDFLNKLSLEAELCYAGAESIEKEVEVLFKEFKKESVKERLENLAAEVRQLELAGKKEELEQKLGQFKELSRELTEESI